jgi:hypothetical protein
VGNDLRRKLGRDDRLLVPILAGISRRLPFHLILEAWIKGCRFSAVGENGRELEGDRKFRLEYRGDSRRILSEHCKLEPAEHPVLYKSLKQITKLI